VASIEGGKGRLYRFLCWPQLGRNTEYTLADILAGLIYKERQALALWIESK
jgi:hypothetical protein